MIFDGCRPLIVALAVGAMALPGAAAELASPIGTTAEPAPPWQIKGLPQQAQPLTRFSVVALDGVRVLRVAADHAYGNLVHPLAGARAGTLAWRWRVDQSPAGADLQKKGGADSDNTGSRSIGYLGDLQLIDSR